MSFICNACHLQHEASPSNGNHHFDCVDALTIDRDRYRAALEIAVGEMAHHDNWNTAQCWDWCQKCKIQRLLKGIK